MAMVVLHSTLPCVQIAEKRKCLPSGAAQGCTPASQRQLPLIVVHTNTVHH